MWTEYWLWALSKLANEKSVVRLTGCPDLTIAVDWDVKPHPNNKKTSFLGDVKK